MLPDGITRRLSTPLLMGTALIMLAACPERPAPTVPVQPTAAATAPPLPPPAPRPVATLTPPAPHLPERVVLIKGAMGTKVTLVAYTSDTQSRAAVELALMNAFKEIKRIELLMTTWRDDSEVSAINAAAGVKAVKVGDETFTVLEKSIWIGNKSEGTFDITFASMGKLWRFDEDRVDTVPSRGAIAAARKRIDFRRVLLNPADQTVKLERRDTKISLGGIAKGYGIDQAAAVLDEAGLASFYAQAGGDLFVRGKKPDGTTWKVGIRDPRNSAENSFFAFLPVEDHAFSTAGDYERSFIKNGKRYHHIIDPRTGHPATASRSVTVWAKDALTADAIDDAVFILGPEKGMALVDSIEDCGAVIVDKNNKVWISPRLKPLVRVIRAPTNAL